MAMPIIDDHTHLAAVMEPVVGGERKARGAVPRDYDEFPQEMFESPSEMDVIPEKDWPDCIRQKDADKSWLTDIRDAAGMPSLDQARSNYCWGHSSTHALMLSRLASNQPHVPLSAYSVAASIKRGANEGGWCGLSHRFLRDKGCVPQSVWPQGDFNYRNYDRPDVWAEAAKYRVTEDWYDLAKRDWDHTMTFAQVASCLLRNVPVAVDFNWWGHSVCAVKLAIIDGEVCLVILNSWSDQWGERGLGVLKGSRKYPDGAVAPRVSVAA